MTGGAGLRRRGRADRRDATHRARPGRRSRRRAALAPPLRLRAEAEREAAAGGSATVRAASAVATGERLAARDPREERRGPGRRRERREETRSCRRLNRSPQETPMPKPAASAAAELERVGQRRRRLAALDPKVRKADTAADPRRDPLYSGGLLRPIVALARHSTECGTGGPKMESSRVPLRRLAVALARLPTALLAALAASASAGHARAARTFLAVVPETCRRTSTAARLPGPSIHRRHRCPRGRRPWARRKPIHPKGDAAPRAVRPASRTSATSFKRESDGSYTFKLRDNEERCRQPAHPRTT